VEQRCDRPISKCNSRSDSTPEFYSTSEKRELARR
jgi:hypothetical protein